MKVTSSESTTREVTLTLEVEEERVKPHLERAARKISREADVPGYRRGKAPYQVIERAFGERTIVETALEELGPELVREALEGEKLTPLVEPRLSIRELNPLVLEVKAVLPPKVELGEYPSIRVAPEKVEVKDEDVEAALREIQERSGEWVSADRPAVFGDQLVLDMVGQVSPETLFEAKETTFIPREKLPLPIPGFSEKLVGLTPDGEEVTFTLSYPEDSEDKALAGKEVACRVSIYDVQKRELPALDDDLAHMMGDFENLEDLKGKVRQDLKERLEAEAQERLTDQALRELVAISKVEYPAIMVDAEVESLLADHRRRVEGQGLTMDGYLQMLKKTETAYRQELRPRAEERLSRALVLGELVKAEGIEVKDEELQGEIDTLARFYGQEGEELRQGLSKEEAREELRSRILARRAILRLVELAKGEAPEAGQAEPTATTGQGEEAPEAPNSP